MGVGEFLIWVLVIMLIKYIIDTSVKLYKFISEQKVSNEKCIEKIDEYIKEDNISSIEELVDKDFKDVI